MSVVSAQISLSDVGLYWNNELVEYVNPDEPFVAHLMFSYESDEDIQTIVVDVSQLNPRRYLPPITVLSSSCLPSQSGFDCLIPNIIVQSESSPLVTFNFTNSTPNSTLVEHQFAFTIDQTHPEVTFLGTSTCNAGRCFVGDDSTSTIIVNMQDDQGSFLRRHVYYSLNGRTNLVYNCIGLACFGHAKTSCTDGQSVRLAISSYGGRNSQDDAGNDLTGVLESFLVCDAKAPEFVGELDLSSGSGVPVESDELPRPFIAKGDTVKISVQVKDTISPTMNITADVSAIDQDDVQGTCTKSADVWTCQLSIVVSAPESISNAQIKIIASDFVGLTTTKTLTIDILDPDPNTVVRDWRVKSLSPPSQSVNKKYLEYTPKTMYTTISLQALRPQQTLIDVEKGACIPYNNLGKTGDVQDMEIIAYDSSEVVLTTVLNMGSRYADYDVNKYNCTFSVLTKRDNFLRTKYEQVQFILQVDFHNTKTIGELVNGEIQRTLDEQEESAKKLVEVKAALNMASRLCSIMGMGKGAGAAANLAATGLLVVPPTQPAGRAVDKSGEGIQQTFENMDEIAWLCEALSCKSKYNLAAAGAIGDAVPAVNTVSQALGYNSYAETLDPYDSFITAALMICPPALVYHQERWQGINCEYAQCLARDVGSGIATIEDCQDMQGFAQCVFIAGGVANGMPFASAIKKTLGTLVETMSNPVSLFTTAGTLLFCRAADGDATGVAGAACRAQAGFAAKVEAIKTVLALKDQFNTAFGSTVGQSSCDAVRQSIEKTDTYWIYREPRDDDSTFQYRQVKPLGNNGELYCNDFNGCSTPVRDATGGMHTLTINGNRAYIDGKLAGKGTVDAAKMLGLSDVEMAQYTTIETLAKERTAEYYEEMSESVDSDIYTAYMDLDATLSRYNDNIGEYKSILKESQDAYDAVDKGPKAIEQIGKANDQLQKTANSLSRRYAEAKRNNDQNTIDTIEYVLDCYNCDADHGNFNLDNMRAASTRLNDDSPNIRKLPRYKDIDDELGDMQEATEKWDDAMAVYETAVAADTDKLTYFLDPETVGRMNKDTANNYADDVDNSELKEKTKREKIAAEETIKNLEKQKKDAITQAQFSQYYEGNWRGWSRSLRSTLRFATAVNEVGPWLSERMFGGFATEWKETLYGFLRDKTGFIGKFLLGEWEQQFCKSKLGDGDNALLVSQTASITYKNSVHVEGIRINEVFGEDNYTYIVHAYVSNHDQDDNLIFDIRLKNDDGSSHTLLTRYELSQGQVYQKTKNQYLKENLREKYTEICVRFHNDNLWKWFNQAGNNREFCRGLERE